MGVQGGGHLVVDDSWGDLLRKCYFVAWAGLLLCSQVVHHQKEARQGAKLIVMWLGWK